MILVKHILVFLMGRPRLFEVNDFAFSTKTPEMEYWTGFLMADGSVYRRKETQQAILKVTLHRKDEKHIEKLREFLQTGYRIFRYNNNSNTPVSELRIPSQQIVDDLSQYGVIPRKSMNAEVFMLQDSADFWRGVMDGDGYLGTAPTNDVDIVGSFNLLSQFSYYVKSIILNAPFPKIVPHKSIYRLRLRKIHKVKILQTLYYDNCISLERKYIRAQNILQFYSSCQIKTSWNGET